MVTTPQVTPQNSPHWLHMFFTNFWVRPAITGHSARMDERAAYGVSIGTFVQVAAEYLAKAKAPLADPG